jgi:selenocysteine lyase/cysteine desulfurase
VSEALNRVREREYPDSGSGIFLNAASWGLVPRSSAREVADLGLRRSRAGGFEEAELGAALRRCRAALATLLDVAGSEIALAPNTSYGINLGAALAGTGEPGTVLVSEGEFPANVLPWKALEPRGFRVEVVPSGSEGLPREKELLRRLEAPEVRALAVSAVQFSTGYRMELERLGEACRRHGVLFVVDAIQALGAVPLRPAELHVDLLACGGQKWLCAPWGSGFAWVPRRHHHRLDPPMVSWLAVEGALELEGEPGYALHWLDDARRYELGTLGIQDYLGLARSVEVLLECGVEKIRRHLLDLHEPVVRWIRSRADVQPVTPLDPDRRAGILSFRPRDLDAVAGALRRLDVTFAQRGGAIRLAPHFYNTTREVERVVEALEVAVRA